MNKQQNAKITHDNSNREVVSNTKPDWWPQNPYPESIFTMTIDEYIKAIPDPNLRSAISGCNGRLFWDIASKSIWDKLKDHLEDLKAEISSAENNIMGIVENTLMGVIRGAPIERDEQVYMLMEDIRKQIKETYEKKMTFEFTDDEIEILKITERHNKSSAECVSLSWWDDMKQMLLNKYKDKPNDYYLSIGHWEDDIGLGHPQFIAYLKIAMEELRSS